MILIPTICKLHFRPGPDQTRPAIYLLHFISSSTLNIIYCIVVMQCNVFTAGSVIFFYFKFSFGLPPQVRILSLRVWKGKERAIKTRFARDKIKCVRCLCAWYQIMQCKPKPKLPFESTINIHSLLSLRDLWRPTPFFISYPWVKNLVMQRQ